MDNAIKNAVEAAMKPSVFDILNDVNVNDKTELKNGLTYLSWAYCWGEVKKVVPDAQYTIYERDTEFGPVNYFTDGKTCWVKTGVTLDGLEHIEQLPVMDFKNKSIPLNAVTSTDVNKAIQRSLTKACARHGLGLYIYAGEDLPECEKDEKPDEIPAVNTAAKQSMSPEANAIKARVDAQYQATRGSTEAAQEAGNNRLKEIEQQMKQARESAPASPVRSTATDEQIAFIRENADGKTLKSAMEAFGPNMEKMTQAQANKLIARIKGGAA